MVRSMVQLQDEGSLRKLTLFSQNENNQGICQRPRGQSPSGRGQYQLTVHCPFKKSGATNEAIRKWVQNGQKTFLCSGSPHQRMFDVTEAYVSTGDTEKSHGKEVHSRFLPAYKLSLTQKKCKWLEAERIHGENITQPCLVFVLFPSHPFLSIDLIEVDELLV